MLSLINFLGSYGPRNILAVVFCLAGEFNPIVLSTFMGPSWRNSNASWKYSNYQGCGMRAESQILLRGDSQLAYFMAGFSKSCEVASAFFHRCGSGFPLLLEKRFSSAHLYEEVFLCYWRFNCAQIQLIIVLIHLKDVDM